MTLTDDLTLLLQALDKCPQDRHLLLVIAGCCDDQTYGSGEGWRALYALNRHVYFWSATVCWGWWNGKVFHKDNEWHGRSVISEDWFVRFEKGHRGGNCQLTVYGEDAISTSYRVAADAFLRLPAERRAQLLKETT